MIKNVSQYVHIWSQKFDFNRLDTVWVHVYTLTVLFDLIHLRFKGEVDSRYKWKAFFGRLSCSALHMDW